MIIQAPASKSSSLRALISCCLANDSQSMTIHNISRCADVLQGIEVVCSLRAFSYAWENNDLVLSQGICSDKEKKSITLGVGESGFLARILVSIGLCFSPEIILTGKGTILTRELGITEFAHKIGVNASSSTLPTTISGKLQAGEFLLREKNSSQFLSGLLFTLPLLKEDSLVIIEELVSRPYLELTLSYLERCGIKFSWISEQELSLPGNQQYKVSELSPESDWSSLSYIIALGIMKGDITITNIIDAPNLPDRIILSLIDEIGGSYSFLDDSTLCLHKSKITGFSFDLLANPDLAPVLVALALAATSPSVFKNCYRLRDKESDRLISLIDMLKVLKVNHTYENDCLTIFPSKVVGGEIKTNNDHRIGMTALILNAISSEKITIDNYLCINKSYPDFLSDLKILGVRV